jgi:CMP-N,N'-diacetyllegionaminic acid synthase
MKILFTICGRAGSKGIKNKNLKDFLGYPLPFYTVSVIDLFEKNISQYNCDIVLNTDSTELMNLFETKLNIPYLIVKRDSKLGQDNTPKIEVVRNSYLIVKDRLGKEYDMIIDLDITSPMRMVTDLERLVDKKRNSDADVVFSVTNSRRNPFFNMVIKTEKGFERVIKSDYNARQEAPEAFDMNASMYAYSPNFLVKKKGIFDGKCDVIKMLDTAVLDIDNERDFELMEVIGEYLFKKNSDLDAVRANMEAILK